MDGRVRSMLVWLIMAGLCGLIGFAVVFYYVNNERPIERFAIVIDAGSTQTRSSLFRISIDQRALDEVQAHENAEGLPLGQLLQVQQVSSCINGGPLAAIRDQHAAQALVEKCLIKFTDHIRLLDFIEARDGEPSDSLGRENDGDGEESPGDALDADAVSRQMALVNHRVNSVTHLHLGATAGMRALEQSNATKASERIAWIEQAIGETNGLLSDDSPYINQGFVGILDGADEASFGWVSVNFVCGSLMASGTSQIAPQAIAPASGPAASTGGSNKSDEQQKQQHPQGHTSDLPTSSVGTLELGGASAQFAFRVSNSATGSRQVQNMSLEVQQLDLFGSEYKLGTRSDLCLGMSQAVLRANYILLHKRMLARSGNGSNTTDKIVNACMQKGSSLQLEAEETLKLWQSACLAPNSQLTSAELAEDATFRSLVASRDSIKIVGSGNVDQCNLLLDELIQPSSCRRYFAICPKNKNPLPPPSNIPFVAISGYNHALKVLELSPQISAMQPASLLAQTIAERLGGHSVVFDEFVQKTREFCSTDLSKLTTYFAKVNKQYQNIICLQLVYIRKLLTEFYRFDPQTNWQQIKFLIFKPTSVANQYTKAQTSTHSAERDDTEREIRPDIGWTLGLLLNATSEELSTLNKGEIYFHHGASAMYITRTTILLILACFLIAVAMLVIGILEVHQAQDGAEAYISHGSSRFSYDFQGNNEGHQRMSINSIGYLTQVEPDKQPPP